jgi:hypothetical protein
VLQTTFEKGEARSYLLQLRVGRLVVGPHRFLFPQEVLSLKDRYSLSPIRRNLSGRTSMYLRSYLLRSSGQTGCWIRSASLSKIRSQLAINHETQHITQKKPLRKKDDGVEVLPVSVLSGYWTSIAMIRKQERCCCMSSNSQVEAELPVSIFRSRSLALKSVAISVQEKYEPR